MCSEELEVTLGRLLQKAGWTLATAESCTGGLIGHRVTNVPGSSTYFLGGVIAYSNLVKERVLGVRPETLSRYGAVSEETAQEMSLGAGRLFGADVSMAVTGIAGPTGGSIDKPIGLVYVAIRGPHQTLCRSFRFDGDRLRIKHQSADAALCMAIEVLAGQQQST